MIRAVVLDIGSVLEIIDDSVFPAPFEQRHGLAPGAVEAVEMPEGAVITEQDARVAWQAGLALSEEQTDELVADFWRWYVGTLDRRLFDWFVAQRADRLTAILSNSAPGARAAERCWGFEEVTDDIVYSHEVGLAKPDPAVYELTTRRLGVRPHEIVFLDDVRGHVVAARAAGWHAVHHRDTARSIAELEKIIADEEVAVR